MNPSSYYEWEKKKLTLIGTTNATENIKKTHEAQGFSPLPS